MRCVSCQSTDMYKDGVLHICIEVLYEAQRKCVRRDPENFYLADMMSTMFLGPFREIYEKRVAGTINGQIQSWEDWEKVKSCTAFRKGLEHLTNDAYENKTSTPNFDEMDR